MEQVLTVSTVPEPPKKVRKSKKKEVPPVSVFKIIRATPEAPIIVSFK
jgi:hypothetical protein